MVARIRVPLYAGELRSPMKSGKYEHCDSRVADAELRQSVWFDCAASRVWI